MEIRPMTEHDVAATAAMLGSMVPWSTYGIGPSAWAQTLGALAPEERAYVAMDQEQVVGFVLFRLNGTFHHSGYIRTLAISPDRAGQGLGRQLLAFAEEQILSRGPNVFLLCSSFNVAAQRFYEHLGYSLVGRLENYLLADEAELIYRRSTGPIRR